MASDEEGLKSGELLRLKMGVECRPWVHIRWIDPLIEFRRPINSNFCELKLLLYQWPRTRPELRLEHINSDQNGCAGAHAFFFYLDP